MLNFFPTCRIGFQKRSFMLHRFAVFAFEEEEEQATTPNQLWRKFTNHLLDFRYISSRRKSSFWKKCHICCVTIERNVPGKTKRKAAKRKSLPYFTSLASRISDQVSTTEDTTFRGSQKGERMTMKYIRNILLTLKIKLPLYQNTSKRHL